MTYQPRIFRARHARRGFTLPEAVLGAVIAGVLMTGMVSAMMLASHALPAADTAQNSESMARAALDQWLHELRYARSVSSRSTRHIEFTVPDRTGDTVPEIIRYEWSGTSGQPLTRTYNAGTPQTVLNSVHTLNLTWTDYLIEETKTDTVVTSETPIASFLGWGGILASTINWDLTSTRNVLQHANLSAPGQAISLEITRLTMMMIIGNSTSPVTISLHERGGTSALPTPGTQFPNGLTTIERASLPASYDWVTASFSGVEIKPPPAEVVIYLRGTDMNSIRYSARVQAFNSVLAPFNDTTARTSSTGGSTWSSSLLNTNDMLYTLYGKWTSEVEVDVSQPYLERANVSIRLGADGAQYFDGGVQCMNLPIVTGG